MIIKLTQQYKLTMLAWPATTAINGTKKQTRMFVYLCNYEYLYPGGEIFVWG